MALDCEVYFTWTVARRQLNVMRRTGALKVAAVFGSG